MIKVESGIRTLADSIAERYDVPVPLLQIAEDELIKVVVDDYGSSTFDGLTWFEASTDDFFIHLNNNQSRKNHPSTAKGRFTLAHELGHYFIPNHRQGLISGELKPHGSINYLVDQSAWQIEREADAFASVLLMPTKSIKEFIERKPFNFHLVEEIAAQYNVSKSAAALRLVEIGNYSIMIVYAVDGVVRWVNRSEDFPFWRLRYGSSRGDRVPENTVMGSFFYEKDASDCGKEQIVFAQDCFDTRRVEDNEKRFIEWCIGYQNKAFSVFWEE